MKISEALHDTRTLQANITKLTEAQLEQMLAVEQARRPPRKLVLERVHQRYCILRAKRERAQLLRGL